MNAPEKKLVLALSGGGYRAAAFHLGTLKKLHELNVLEKVDVLSTISGGSITGAYYCLNKYDFPGFEKSFYDTLQTKSVIKRTFWPFGLFKIVIYTIVIIVPAVYFLFTPYAWLSIVLLVSFMALVLKFQFYIFPVGKQIERSYADLFFKNARLGDLAPNPELRIAATNLQTGGVFIFSRICMEDPGYKQPVEFNSTAFPVARAVMASCSPLFVYSPVTIGKKYFLRPERDYSRISPQLVDAGIHGHETNQYNSDMVISCDGGNKLPAYNHFGNSFSLFARTVNIFIAREISGNAGSPYLSLDSDIENCIPAFIECLGRNEISAEVIKAHQLHPDWVENPVKYEGELTDHLHAITCYKEIIKPDATELELARSITTDLRCLSKSQIDCLMKQAAALTELQVLLYCPGLLKK